LFASPAVDKAMMDGLKVDMQHAIDKIKKDQTKNHLMD
jgi:hypothetical protein